MTTKRKEVDHILWGWGSVPRVLRARGSSAIKTHKMYLKSSFTRFSSADPSRKENLSKANLSLDLFDFLFWRQLSNFFNFLFSFVHFICAFYWQERSYLLNLAQLYSASSGSCRAPTSKWLWLTDQSERALYFCYVINYSLNDDVYLVSFGRKITRSLAFQGAFDFQFLI